LDHIIGLDVVLANGTQIYTDNATYPDIFYAMRGAGDSFGIVTYFYMATEEAPSSVVYFTAGLASSLSDVDVVTAGFENLQNFSLNSELMSDNLTFGMYTDSSGSFSLSGWCMSCDIAQFNSTVFPAMLKGFTYSSTTVES
jgi:FAD/FMN-containing dehydrogenase